MYIYRAWRLEDGGVGSETGSVKEGERQIRGPVSWPASITRLIINTMIVRLTCLCDHLGLFIKLSGNSKIEPVIMSVLPSMCRWVVVTKDVKQTQGNSVCNVDAMTLKGRNHHIYNLPTTGLCRF